MTGKQHPKRRTSRLDDRAGPPASARLGPDVRDKIGGQLRDMYDDVVKQGVPDRFAELLKRLDTPPNDSQE